uniref:Putative odorant receptor 26 n=1 Tax=Conopomorpha sinensis TaxID=940481 RepID=A0A3Q8HD97_9NEOP|nr:putative odorant receptor 26 [Conopomorpha sinensis]
MANNNVRKPENSDISEETPPSEFTDLMYGISKFVFLCGMPNYWPRNLHYNVTVMKYYSLFSKIVHSPFVFVVVLQYMSFFTEQQLSAKQQSDRVLYCITHPFFGMSVVWGFYRQELFADITHDIVVTLRQMYHDTEVDKAIVKKLVVFTTVYKIGALAVVPAHGCEMLYQVIVYGDSFTCLATAWPLVNDRSVWAEFGRAAIYTMWFFFILKLSGIYLMTMTLTMCLSHQYLSLCSYFINLPILFESNEDIIIKEKKYEKAFKYGVKMHAETLRCALKAKTAFGVPYTGQIIINTIVFVQILTHVVQAKEVNVAALMPILASLFVCLMATGMFMCNAGDITIQAAKLPSAMFASGWHMCSGGAMVRMRSLVTIAITQAQVVPTIYILLLCKILADRANFVSWFLFLDVSYSTFKNNAKF